MWQILLGILLYHLEAYLHVLQLQQRWCWGKRAYKRNYATCRTHPWSSEIGKGVEEGLQLNLDLDLERPREDKKELFYDLCWHWSDWRSRCLQVKPLHRCFGTVHRWRHVLEDHTDGVGCTHTCVSKYVKSTDDIIIFGSKFARATDSSRYAAGVDEACFVAHPYRRTIERWSPMERCYESLQWLQQLPIGSVATLWIRR